jgi:hypothetical protein
MIYKQDRCKNERESGFFYRRLPLPEGADQSKSRQHFIMGYSKSQCRFRTGEPSESESD